MSQGNKKKRLVVILRSELERPDASVLLGKRIAALPPVPLETGNTKPRTFEAKQTHKGSEPKAKPRSYRFGESVERDLQKVTSMLGIENQTTFVEAAIRAACAKVINNKRKV